jgi:hypothetical protein
MTTDHTPTPWADDGFGRIGATDSDQFNGGFFTAICEGPDKAANARRIMACVNACAGVSTENLEDNEPVKELARRYNDTIKQRDEVMAALERMVAMHDSMMKKVNHGASFYDVDCLREMNEAPIQAQVAIANVKGGA